MGSKKFLRGGRFLVSNNMVSVVSKKVKAVGLLGVGILPCFYTVDTFLIGVC